MITAVIPVYNEPKVLEFRARLIHALNNLPYMAGYWDIVWVVGDPQAFAQLENASGGCERIIYEKDRGLGRALTLGFRAVDPSSEWVLTMDSDLQQLPEEIPALWEVFLEDNDTPDIIIGAKGIFDSRGRTKRLVSKIFYWALRTLHGVKVRDMGSNFRLYRRWVRRQLPLEEAPSGFKFMQWALFKAWDIGANVIEIPTTFTERTAGKSKMSLWRELRERLL